MAEPLAGPRRSPQAPAATWSARAPGRVETDRAAGHGGRRPGPDRREERDMIESTRGTSALAGLDGIIAGLEELYRDVHAHPELSMQERRTAAKAAERLQAAGYVVTIGVGGTGV